MGEGKANIVMGQGKVAAAAVGLVVSIVMLLPVLAGVGAEAAPPRKPRPTPTPTATVTPTPTATPSPTMSPSPTATTSPQPDACGTPLAKPDGSSWQCTFVDDFGGTALDRTKWLPQTNLAHGSDAALSCFVDDPANVAVADGSLRLTVRPAATPINCNGKTAGYTAGGVSTYDRFGQQYGRFEARMKVAATREVGLQEAFWLWPDARVASTAYWPAAGEIDIAETYSQYPDLAIPFLHYTWYDNWGPVPGVNTAWTCAASRGVWNTYTLLWDATRLEILVNGKTCLVNTSGDPAFQKPYIVALSQFLGGAANSFTGAAPMPATTEVDYVKVWR
jgi:beta-glucanase (GH16 family)